MPDAPPSEPARPPPCAHIHFCSGEAHPCSLARRRVSLASPSLNSYVRLHRCGALCRMRGSMWRCARKRGVVGRVRLSGAHRNARVPCTAQLMFNSATAFNIDISSWDVRKVTDMKVRAHNALLEPLARALVLWRDGGGAAAQHTSACPEHAMPDAPPSKPASLSQAPLSNPMCAFTVVARCAGCGARCGAVLGGSGAWRHSRPNARGVMVRSRRTRVCAGRDGRASVAPIAMRVCFARHRECSAARQPSTST